MTPDPSPRDPLRPTEADKDVLIAALRGLCVFEGRLNDALIAHVARLNTLAARLTGER